MWCELVCVKLSNVTLRRKYIANCLWVCELTGSQQGFLPPFLQNGPITSLSCRSTKHITVCRVCWGRPLSTACLHFIPFFCIQLLHCVLTSAASFPGEPHHKFSHLSWKTSHEVLTKTLLQYFYAQEGKGGEVAEIARSLLSTGFVHSLRGLEERVRNSHSYQLLMLLGLA